MLILCIAYTTFRNIQLLSRATQKVKIRGRYISQSEMDCPCYRAIYSAAINIPTAVIIIISGYAHVIPDSEIVKILNGPDDSTSMFLSVDSEANVNGEIGNYRVNQSIRGPGQCGRFRNSGLEHTTSDSIYYKYDNVFSFAHRGCMDEFKCTRIKIASPQWDSILDHVGPRREEIWHKMYPDTSPPREFINWCNIFIKIFIAQLETCEPVCPWQ